MTLLTSLLGSSIRSLSRNGASEFLTQQITINFITRNELDARVS